MKAAPAVLMVVTAAVIGQIAFAAPAWAQPAQPAPQQQQQPPQQQPQPQPANPWQAPPPGAQIYQAPPPGYPPPGYPPPGYPPPPGYGPYYGPNNQMALANYEAQRRNSGLAVLIEILVPGLGSLYGDHGVGALITWGLMIAGIVLVVAGINQSVSEIDAYGNTHSSNGPGGTEIVIGFIMLLGGRIYGLVDSYQATEEFNRRLRVRLGLPAGFTMGIGPVGKGTMSIGPHVGFTF